MPVRLKASAADFPLAFETLLGAKRENAVDVRDVVEAILADVRCDGDHALIRLTEKFDRLALTPETLRVSEAEIDMAESQCDQKILAALDVAAQRIHEFHARQLPEDISYTDPVGVKLGLRWTAVDAAGLYVPGGTASYPSSVLMNAIPAKVAGVKRLVMTVPTPDGVLNPLVLAAAKRAGVDEVYRIGGAQAVGALAYGTDTIAPVDKIVGPGNAFVAAAKRAVFGTVGIDMVAGPSEILVIADADNNPDWIAVDLLSQAEHDMAAQSILITDDAAFADAVVAAVHKRLETLPRANIAAASWRDHGAVIVVDDLADAISLTNRIAPEHLELAVADPERFAAGVRHAGAIFMGRMTPEALGDYVGGPNHVLPTARSAKFSSGLGVIDFLKRTTLLQADTASIAEIGPAAVALAECEGLTAHGLSVALRLPTVS